MSWPNIKTIHAIRDPEVRARALDNALTHLDRVVAELRVMRRAAVQEMHAGGLSHAQIGRRLGISSTRVGQILAEPKSVGDAT